MEPGWEGVLVDMDDKVKYLNWRDMNLSNNKEKQKTKVKKVRFKNVKYVPNLWILLKRIDTYYSKNNETYEIIFLF